MKNESLSTKEWHTNIKKTKQFLIHFEKKTIVNVGERCEQERGE